MEKIFQKCSYWEFWDSNAAWSLFRSSVKSLVSTFSSISTVKSFESYYHQQRVDHTRSWAVRRTRQSDVPPTVMPSNHKEKGNRLTDAWCSRRGVRTRGRALIWTPPIGGRSVCRSAFQRPNERVTCLSEPLTTDCAVDNDSTTDYQ